MSSEISHVTPVEEMTNDLDRAMTLHLDVISEEDALRLENASLEVDSLIAQAEAIQQRLSEVTARGNALGAILRARYQIVDGDTVDMAKRLVVRK